MIKKRVSSRDKDYGKVLDLLQTEFPESEQMPIWLLRLLSLIKKIHFTAYYEGTEFIGLSFVSEGYRTAFVLYLAVSHEIQSKGYGSKIIQDIIASFPGKNVTLNIEPLDPDAPNYQQREKRLQFYQRNGFHDTGYTLEDNGDPYSVLTTGNEFSVDDYKNALRVMSLGALLPRIYKK